MNIELMFLRILLFILILLCFLYFLCIIFLGSRLSFNNLGILLLFIHQLIVGLVDRGFVIVD
jgi:O-antigen ligase